MLRTPPEVLQEVLLESLNFFYLNTGLNVLGLSPFPDIPVSTISAPLLSQHMLDCRAAFLLISETIGMRSEAYKVCLDCCGYLIHDVGCMWTQVHPVSLGLFNFVNAWSMMFWPLMLADRKGAAVKNRFSLWLGTQVRNS